MRKIDKTYSDPFDLIWLHAACELGIKVVRDGEVFAAWDGVGVLRIGTAETLDPDDSLAQMILHELCHALIEGPENFGSPDWGLDMDKEDHFVHEHAALRLQAALADRYQLRGFFASTTDFRSYFDQLGVDPMCLDSADNAATLARSAWSRATTGLWGEVIDKALKQTRRIVDIVQDVAPQDSILKLTAADHCDRGK